VRKKNNNAPIIQFDTQNEHNSTKNEKFLPASAENDDLCIHSVTQVKNMSI
jgi:hypothetical protein